MAASFQDHFHIVDSATPGDATTTGEWKAMAPNMKPKALPHYTVIAAPQRALDGTLRPHVLKDGADPVIFTSWAILVRCPTWGNVETWRDMLGELWYLIPPYHDAAAHNSYTQQVLVHKIGEIASPGPTVPVIYLPVTLVDASQ